MKVISSPDVSGWKSQVTCNKCTSVLEINVSDIHSSYYEGDTRDPSYYSHYVSCPICSDAITVLGKSLNPGVRAHLEKEADKRRVSSNSYYDR